MTIEPNPKGAETKLKQYREAIQDYDKVIELNPEDAEAYNNRGIAKADLKQYQEAIQDYDKAIELNPEYADAYNNRGATKVTLEQYREAIQDYDKALELNPGFSDAIHNRAVAQTLLLTQDKQKKITQKYEEQLKEQQQKFEGESQDKPSAAEKAIGETSDYDAIMEEMEEDHKSKAKYHRYSIICLIIASIILYGVATWVGIAMMKDQGSHSILPFIVVATLVLVPFYLWAHSADKDKTNALALREDIRSKRAVTKHYERSGGKSDPALYPFLAPSGIPEALIQSTFKEPPGNFSRPITWAKTFGRNMGADSE